jgi:hypothetical protein
VPNYRTVKPFSHCFLSGKTRQELNTEREKLTALMGNFATASKACGEAARLDPRTDFSDLTLEVA